MRILIADAFPDGHAEQLRSAGHEVVVDASLDAEALSEAVMGMDALVVRSTRVTARTIAATDSLSLIVRAGAGVNTIDLDSAAERAIYVCNVPGRNAIAVAELTMGLLLALDRHIPEATADLRAGRWDKARYSRADGVCGKTMGIIGLGAIGREVATRAVAFGMRVLVEDRPGRDADALASRGVDVVADREALLAATDVVTLHVPLNDETRGMVDDHFIDALRRGAWLLNTSRGEVVRTAALLRGLDERDMRAGLDVFDDEPPTSQGHFDHPLARHPRVVGTHHIGASTMQAQHATADGVVAIVTAHAAGRLSEAVNLETQMLGACTLVVRHRDEVGVLSQVLERVREAGINLEQMQNAVFSGAKAAVATLHLADVPDDDLIAEIRGLKQVIGVRVRGPERAGARQDG